MRVNFVIGGTQKGGTSALDSFLRQHPQICMPDTRKELHFFDLDENFANQPNYKRYHSNFRPGKQHLVAGEATPIYMYWNTAPARIWTYNPEMKWILALRNPVERAFSAWNMETRRAAENLSFREAIEWEAVRCREALPFQHRVFSYLDRGFYAAQLRRLFNIFGQDRCHILLNEDLRANHEETLHGVFNFLEIDASFVATPADVFHQDYDQTLEPALSTALTKMFYFDIKEVEHLLGRDLSIWYQDYKPRRR